MWQLILSAIGSWLPSLGKSAVDAYRVKKETDNNSERIAADLASRELGVAERESELNAAFKTQLIGRWYEPTQLLGYIMVAYVGKVVVWDKVLGLGVTDPITGAVGEWAGAIIMFLIGKRGIENVARIIRR